MCYTATPYHLWCGHYGKPAISGEPCIRALTAAGSSRGCWSTVDLGTDSVQSQCPRCAKSLLLSPSLMGDQLSRVSSITSSGASTPSLDPLDGLKKVDSSMSLSSMRSWQSGASTASGKIDDGQTVGMQDLERQAFYLMEMASGAGATSGRRVEPENLHWRTFGGSAASVRFKRDVV